MANHRKRIKIACTFCKKEYDYLPSLTRGKYCSNKCQGQDKVLKNYLKNKSLFEKGLLTYRKTIKFFILERDGKMCSSCKGTTWQGQPIPLWLDHIDGNASNNTPENFRLLCPNCDSLNETFGGKNRGNGRRSRGMKPWA